MRVGEGISEQSPWSLEAERGLMERARSVCAVSPSVRGTASRVKAHT